MIDRILGVSAGVFLLFLLLFLRGVPVLFFIKMIPLILLFLFAIALIWAGLAPDEDKKP